MLTEGFRKPLVYGECVLCMGEDASKLLEPSRALPSLWRAFEFLSEADVLPFSKLQIQSFFV